MLLDDDPRELEKLGGLIGAYYSARGKGGLSPGNPRRFSAGSAALEYLAEGRRVDIAFLDIVMPGMSGVQFAGILRDKGFKGYIVFLTSVNDFASESYKVGAFSYVLKPVKREQLFSLLERIEEHWEKSRKEEAAAVMVQTKKFSRNLPFREIVFTEVIGRTLHIHLVKGETVSINKAMKDFAPSILDDGRFSHCHSSIIVNMDFVETIRDNAAVLKTGQSIPISRRYNDFKSRYIAYSIRRPG